MTACCLIKQFHIPTHTHTCTSQYTLKNTHNHESLHKYTNTVHTPSLSWHQSRLADFLNSTNEIKKVLLKSSYSVKFCLKNLKSFINFDLAVEATGIFLFNSILFTQRWLIITVASSRFIFARIFQLNRQNRKSPTVRCSAMSNGLATVEKKNSLLKERNFQQNQAERERQPSAAG